MSSSKEQDPPTSRFYVWEGEWLELRKFITTTRFRVTGGYYRMHKLLHEDFNLFNNAQYCATYVDGQVVNLSRYLSNSTFDAPPWVVPATGIGLLSSVIGVKSARRWGVLRGMRNGGLCSVVLVLALYPHDVKDNLLSLMEHVL